MGADLPAGKYTASLVGAWWPQPSTALKAGAAHWRLLQEQQEQYARDLRNQWTQLGSRNQGHTVDDLVTRLQKGEKYHLDLAEKYKAKASSFEKGADAIDNLREGLRGIADDYNQRISNVENSKGSAAIKAAEIEKLIAEANGFASYKSGSAVATIVDATQQILTAEGIEMSAQQFLDSHGSDPGTQPAMGGGMGCGGLSGGSQPGKPMGSAIGDGNAGGLPEPPGLPHGQNAGTAFGRGIVQPGGGGGDCPSPVPAVGPGHMPGPPGVGAPSPGGGGLSPAAAFGTPSPNQMANSFAQGMATGQPAAASANQLSQGLMNATGQGSTPPPPAPVAPPVSVPAVTAGIDASPVEHGSTPAASAGSATPAASTGTGGAVPVATPMVGGGTPVAAPLNPVTGVSPTPPGPLPAYGSDLRPPVVAAPSLSAPTTPVSGAPVAPSPSTSPSAGSPLMSTVQRGSAVQTGATPAAPAGAAALSATTGAVAGDVSTRAAEQQRLQRIVDAVARQAPGLSWAAGLRDDGTTLLVGEIGCGWIPPNVKIPVGVNRLLEPALRRTDAGVVDLLGAVTAAAAHKANGFVAKRGPDDPALTGDRLARTGPHVDELGPTLVEAVRRRDGLPRIAQTLAQAATRGTGVTDNEMTVLENEQAAAYQQTLDDPRDLSKAANWMLLAAIQALIEGHEFLAHYHVAWYEAVSVKLR